jgi:cation:H+ antiporter
MAVSLRGRKGSPMNKSGGRILQNVSWILASAILIYVGSAGIVGSGGDIMNHFGWGATAVGTVFFALSTSFPEIATSLISIVKFQKTSVVIGNVLGSNISNIFLFGIISAAYNLNLTPSIEFLGGLLVLAEILLLGIFILYRKKDQIQIPAFIGILLISIYLIFLVTIS